VKITEGQKDVTLGLLEGGGDSRGVGVGGGGGSWVVGGLGWRPRTSSPTGNFSHNT